VKLLVSFKLLTSRKGRIYFQVAMFFSSTRLQILVLLLYLVSSFLERSIQADSMKKMLRKVVSVNRELHAVLQKLPLIIMTVDLNGKLVK
jgi:hypothetical protein